MASLKRIVSYWRDEIDDGIGWLVVYKNGRRWNAECFWQEDGSYDDGLIFTAEDYSELQDILKIDHNAVCFNGYYYGFCDDMTAREIEDKIRLIYVNQTARLDDYLSGKFIIPL